MMTSDIILTRFNVYRVAIASVIAMGVALRMFGLGLRDFWFDESCTFQYIQLLSAGPDWPTLLRESTNLPYYIIVRGWVSLFGESEAAVRSLSALAASLAMLPLAWTAWMLAGRRAALICLVLSAFHPLHIYYAHEARVYALWSLEMAVVLATLVAAVRSQGSRWWIAYGVALVVAMHTHYVTVFAVLPSLAAVLISRDRRWCIVRWALTTVAALTALVPYAYFAILPAVGTGGREWIADDFDPELSIPQTLWAMLPAGGYPMHLRGLSLLSTDTLELVPELVSKAAMRLPLIIIGACAMLMVLRPKRRTDLLNGRCHHVALGAMAIGPLLALVLFSVVRTPIYLPGRYDMVAWPAIIVWIAVIISDFSGRWRDRGTHVAGGITVLLVLCSLVPINRSIRLRGESPHHRRADRIAEVSGPGDLVIALSYDRDYLLYFLHRADFAGELVSFPSWLDQQVGWLDTQTDTVRVAQLDADAASLSNRIAETLASNHRVFFLEDSMDRPGSPSLRSKINQPLFARLREEGYQARPIEKMDRAPAMYELQSQR